MENQNLTFIDIVLSWGASILVAVAIILTFVGWVNGSIGSLAEFFTQFGFNLVYAIVYVILRMIPTIDTRPPFYPKKKNSNE